MENISIVLVGTLYGGNIGSAARAMMNMGIKDLRLVRPEEILTEDCRNMAVNALCLVESAQVYSSLGEAVSGSSLVIGTTCQRGRNQKVREYSPRDLAFLVKSVSGNSKVSIVFGPERGGLTEKELAECQYLVNIPASPELPTLNLSQAVLIICYELFVCREPHEGTGIHPPDFEYPTQEEREQMFRHIEETLLAIGFLSSGNPSHIMVSLKRLLGGEFLSRRDIKIIRGIMSRMDWFIKHGEDLPPEKIRRP
jgi:TrmH family RNA methyltransferase